MRKIYFVSVAIFLILNVAKSQSYLLNEDFSSAANIIPPTGWIQQTITGTATDKWHFDNPGNRIVNYPVTDPFAIFDSQNYSSSGGNEVVNLESPFVDASGSSCIYLMFDQLFNKGVNSNAQVQIYNGSIWQTVYNIDTNISAINNKSINISSYGAGISNLKVRFKWNGNNGGYWLIDNVKIYSPFTRDMSVTAINYPVNPLIGGNHKISIVLKNFSCSNVNNATIYWKLNNGSAIPYTWNGNLAFNQQQIIDSIGFITIAEGGVYKLKVWISSMNGGQSDMYHLNDTAYITLYPKLCGSFTVGGSNPDFPDLFSVEQALNISGISCPVVFKIRDGNYNEHIKLDSIKGSSIINTVTFQSESGNASNCVINYQNVDPTNDYTINLNGTDNIFIKKLSIIRQNGDTNLILKNNCKNVFLEGNVIQKAIMSPNSLDSNIIFTKNILQGDILCEKTNSTVAKKINFIKNSLSRISLTYTNDIISDSNYSNGNMEYRNCKNISCNYDTSVYSGGYAFYFENCYNSVVKNCKVYLNSCCDGYGIDFESSKNGVFENNILDVQSGCWGWCGTRFGIKLYNSDTILIKSNIINCLNFDYEGFGIYSTGTTTKLTIDGNTIVNSRKGMYMDVVQNFEIKNNIIINVKDYFVQLNGDNGNFINNTMNTIVAGNGINLFSTNTLVKNNKITTINEGICISNNNNNNTIENNYLQAGGLGIAKGIVSNSANYLTAYNNSINITSVDRIKGKAIEINGGSYITLKNNILSNKEGGYALFISGNPSNLDLNYNDYYSFKNKLVHYNGSEYDSLQLWKNASGLDALTLDYNPYYQTDTCLKHNQMKLYNAALVIPTVSNDIYGISRGTTPDIGAYEYNKCAVDAGIHRFIGLKSPLTTGIATPIKVELENHGTTTLSSAIINWTVNGIALLPYSWSGSLLPGQSINIIIGNYTFSAGTTYNLTATSTFPNGGSDCNNLNNTATITELGTKLCGIYTIGGTNPDFLNFTEAAVALNSGGIACSVVFKVRNGSYNEHIILNQIQGASDTATITFESEAGDSTMATLSYNMGDPTNDYTLILDGTDYIRFNKLGIKRSNGNGNIFVNNGCKDVRFTNNELHNVIMSGLDSLLIFRKNNMYNNFLTIDYSFAGYSKDLKISKNKYKAVVLNKCNVVAMDTNNCQWYDWNYSTINLYNISNSKNIIITKDTLLTSNYYTAKNIYLNNNRNVKIKNCYLEVPGGCDGIAIQSEFDTLRYFENNKIFLQNGTYGWCGNRLGIMAKGGDSLYVKGNMILSINHDYTGTGIYIYDEGITNYEISDNTMELFRNGMTLLNKALQNIAKNNKIFKSMYYGIKTTGNSGQLIKNIIHNVSEGVGLISESPNSKYLQNRITGIANGIAMSNNSNGVDIQNNYMQVQGNSKPIGLQITNNATNCNVYNNNINITGIGANNGSAIEIQNATNLSLKNNIFANQTDGFALKIDSLGATITADKNSYFTYGDFLFRKNNQSIEKLNQWITASGQDVNSKNINPFYNSDTNLKMNQIQLNNIAEFVGINFDIDSGSRISNNDIGAKVFNPCTIDAGIDSVIGMLHNLTNTTMAIKGLLQNHGTTTLTSAKIFYSVNGITQPVYNWSGTLAAGATIQVNIGNYTFTAAQSNLKIWTSLPNGSSDCNNYNDTAKFFRISGPLCGIYTVGGINPDFNSIADAVFALNGVGISCPVTFRLRDTIFNQNIAIGPVKGNSFVNTITFERDTFLNSLPGVNYTLTDPVNDYALRLDSTTHVTFRKMTINRQNGSKNIWLRNLNNYLTFDSCKINGLITDTLGLDSVLVVKNCELQNSAINVIGGVIKQVKNITIKNSTAIWASYFNNIDRINIDSCNFIFSGWNWSDLNYNIYFEYCSKISIKRTTADYFDLPVSHSLKFNNCRDIWIEKNNLTSKSYHNNTKTIFIQRSKDITIISNIINPNIYQGYDNSRSGIYAENSSNILVKSNQINSNSTYLCYGIYMIDSVNNVKINKNEINYFEEGIRCNLKSLKDTINENNILYSNTCGIRIEGDSAVVQKNRILNSANIVGIKVMSNNARILQNRIFNLTESEGVRISGQKNLIANNFIHLAGFGVAKGIVIDSGSDYSKIIHNSTNICSTDPLKGKAIEVNGGNNIHVRNNVFSNKGGGYAAYINNLPLGMSSGWNTNSYYSPTYKIAYYNSQNFNNVINWNAAIGSGADYGFYNPYYANDTNLRPYQRFLNGAAVTQPNVNVDIDDQIRNAQAPDIGADEFKVDFGITQMLSPTLECVHGNSDTVKIYIKQFGDIPFMDIPLAYTINGGAVVYDTIPGSTFNDVTHSFPVTINISSNNTYIFKLWIIDAYDDNKANDTLIAIRYSKPAPVINFSAPTYCEDLKTNFTSQATVASPYTISTYHWNFGNGDTSNIANPVYIFDTTGNYPVKLRVFSSSGCYKDTLKNIIVHATPKAEFISAPQCKGVAVVFNNNSIISSSDSLFYNWNFGDATSSIIKNPSHSYSITGSIPVQLITTSNYGCKDTVSHNQTIYTLPNIQLNKQNISCNGLTNGQVSSTVTSGNPSYQYLWSTNATTSGISNLSTGTYILTVTDSMGCIKKDTAIITQPSAISINFNKKAYVCNGMNNGWIKATASGGTSPFIYNWNGGLTGDTVFNLNNGTYIVTVKDSNNCQKTDSVNLISKPQPTIQFTASNVLCFGGNTGKLTANASGGMNPYSYQWQTIPVQTTQLIQNLSKAFYTLKVTDSLGCVKIDSALVNQPDSFNLIVNKTMPLCFGNSNGKIAVICSGATPPYVYSWNTIPVQTTSTANNLAAGNYQLTVKDSNNCTKTISHVLNQPAKLNVQTQTSFQSCVNYCDGKISATVAGGTKPYLYNWNTLPPQTDSIAVNLCEGQYKLIVNDSNNCTDTVQPAFVQTNTHISATFTTNPNYGFSPLDVNFTFTGYGAATYNWNFGDGNTSSQQNPMNIYHDEGNYHIVLIATSAAPDLCMDTASFDLIVDSPSDIWVPNTFTPNGDGFNDFFYAKSQGLKDIKIYIYNRWGAEIFIIESADGKWDGNYMNNPAPEGVYYYVLKAKGKDAKEYEKHGSVTLLR